MRNPPVVTSPAGTDVLRPRTAAATSSTAIPAAARSYGRSVTHITVLRSPVSWTLLTPGRVASCGTSSREAMSLISTSDQMSLASDR